MGSTRKQYSKRSILQDEREINRSQENFSKGVFNDLSKTPANGLLYLKNAIAKTDCVESRPGTTRFAATRPAVLASPLTASKSGTTITITNCGTYTPSSADIGRYFNNGTTGSSWDLITDVTYVCPLNATLTVASGTADWVSSATCQIQGGINALEWHTQMRKWICHIDTRLFYSAWNMSSWVVINPGDVSTNNVTDAPSRIRTFQNYAIIFTSSGEYRVDLDTPYPFYYKLNTKGPQAKSVDVESTGYGRRYLVTYSRLRGTGYYGTSYDVTDKTRQDKGVSVDHESCPNKIEKETSGEFLDYTEIWDSAELSSSNTNALNLYAPSDELWSHYSIWGTLDVGTNGDADNNDERYYHIKDVPMVKALTITSTANSTTITAATGRFSPDDVGSEIWLSTKQTTTGGSPVDWFSYKITTVEADGLSCTTTERTTGHPAFTGLAAGIGCNKTLKCTQSTTTVTKSAGDVFTFASSDVGKTIVWDDGTTSLITGYIGTTSVTVDRSETRTAQGMAFGYYNAGGLVTASRVFCDSYSDDILRNNRAGWLLTNRFFEPVPNCNLGSIVPGFVVFSQSDSDKIYYSQTLYQQHIGYYNPAIQYDRVDDTISALSEFPDYIVAYGKNKPGWKWPIATTKTVSDKSENAVGESIEQLTSRVPLKGGFGIMNQDCIRKDELGRDILLTRDRELRIFDGNDFSENLLADRWMRKNEKIQSAIATHYDKNGGYVYWCTELATV